MRTIGSSMYFEKQFSYFLNGNVVLSQSLKVSQKVPLKVTKSANLSIMMFVNELKEQL